jgi:hypothetical protein
MAAETEFNTIDPGRLHTLNYSFKSARAAHVAAKLDIFTKVHDAGKGVPGSPDGITPGADAQREALGRHRPSMCWS